MQVLADQLHGLDRPAHAAVTFAIDAAAFKEGTVPVKYKELMAVAVGLATQCPYCIAVHTDRAKAAGASEQEVAEAVMVAAAILAGGTVAHGTHTVD